MSQPSLPVQFALRYSASVLHLCLPFLLLTAIDVVLSIFAWRFYLVYLNRSRDKAAAAQGLTPEQVRELGAANAEKDMTGELLGSIS